jgi:spore coat protein CotH
MPDITKFKSSSPQNRTKRELFIIIFLSFLSLSTIFYYSYSENFRIVPSNLPKVYITCTYNINKNTYKECIIEIDYDSTIAEIKLRGNAKTRYDKKGYRIQLTQSKSFLGMRRDDDWQLFAMYNDYTRMKDKLAFDLWRTLEDTNPTAILPDSEFVTLYLNQEYIGLYLLAEKNDRRLFGLDRPKNNTDSSLIFQAQPFTFLREYDKDAWEQDLPDPEDVNIIDKILPDLINFINNTSDEEFYDPETGIYSIFDKLNLIDFFLFNYFILHGDFWCHNYFIVRNTNPSKFFLIPWDFDISFGQAADHLYSSKDNPESEIRRTNELYNRLLDSSEFKEACRNRWIFLRGEVWTEEDIIDRIVRNYEKIENSLKIEREMWFSKARDKDYVKILIEWVQERLEFCDSYFSEF